ARNYIQLYRAAPKTIGGNMKILHFKVFQQTAKAYHGSCRRESRSSPETSSRRQRCSSWQASLTQQEWP
ncbi:hypothetical protein, partial [Bradyrhizobium sp. LB11.1]|uniref:hypothetical protein n=1 Tax=Bradyrhizobium sp. LB11.1 TaxID=3156326 RepID=UPI00339AF54D